MKIKIAKAVKIIIFLLIIVCIWKIVSFLCIPTELPKTQIKLYGEQEEDSIDIAFIGSSATYRFYDIMGIWEEYGVTSMCYYYGGLPFDMTIPMMEYISLNQSPEIYVVDLRYVLVDEYRMKYFGVYERDSQEEAFIDTLDLFPELYFKWDTIIGSNYTNSESYMYMFDILYNHEAFMDGVELFIENGFTNESIDYKGNRLAYSVTDITEDYVDFSTMEENEEYILSEETKARLIEVFEYCEENNLNIYFTFTPYANSKNTYDQEIRCAIGEFIVGNGYAYSDYKSEIQEIGLDFTTDFYDAIHVNALGAEKYTAYAMPDILAAYEFDVEYSQTVIDDWNVEYDDWTVYNEKKVEELYVSIEEMEKSDDSDLSNE